MFQESSSKARQLLAGSIALVVLVGLLPLLMPFLRQLHLYPLVDAHPGLNNFGGYFGGVLGPLITLISFYFLYQAYVAQAADRRAQDRDRQLALYNQLYADLLADIAALRYRELVLGPKGQPATEQVYDGLDALYRFRPDRPNNSVLNHLGLIITSCNYLLTMLHALPAGEPTKALLLDKVYLLYHAKIVWPVLEGLYRYKVDLLKKDWGNPERLFFDFEKLTKQTFQHLANPTRALVKPAPTTGPSFLATIMQIDFASPTARTDWELHAESLKKQFSAPPDLRNKLGVLIGIVFPKRLAQWLRQATLPATAAPPAVFLPHSPAFVERSKNWWWQQYDQLHQAPAPASAGQPQPPTAPAPTSPAPSAPPPGGV